jgi:hypothetical protein
VQPLFQYAKDDKSGSFKEDDEWSGTRTYEESEQLLLFGDTTLHDKIEKAGLAKIRAELSRAGSSRQIYSSVVGVAPNVPAFLAGTPNNMINVRQIKKPVPVVSFAYNTAISASEGSDSIMKVAAALVGAVMKLEKSGVRVDMWTVEVSESGYDTCAWAVKIKEASQPLNALKMAYPMAHPSMLRRQMFRLLETTPGVPKSFVGGYGRPVRDNREALKALNDGGERHIKKVISYYDLKGKSADEIIKILIEK